MGALKGCVAALQRGQGEERVRGANEGRMAILGQSLRAERIDAPPAPAVESKSRDAV